MEVAIKVKGITKRWIMNLISLVAIVIVFLVITLGIAISNYYYNSVQSTVSGIASSFDTLSLYQSTNYEDEARLLAEQFPYKDSVELQIIDHDGNVIVSTNGFIPDSEDMPDYANAVKSESSTYKWIGKNRNNEKIMAYTYMLPEYSGNSGAVRCIVSLERVDRQITFIICIIAAVGIGIILFCFIYGMYFVNSIVRPVREVGNIARRIATGDLKARIDVKENNEIGELCDTINYMANELEENEKLKNDFISSVSHELRTPLTAIKGWGETVKGAISSDRALVEKGIDIIIGESERLSGLVEELLDFSRMQSGRLSLKMERLDILAELGEAVFMYEDAARRAGITLSFDEPDQVSSVIGDANRLEQVFINVIDNAVKYTNRGGVINVKAENEEGCVKITVSDTGVGIPSADIDRVKEKFYKANKDVRGSGIGLAVADEIIKQHNGLLFLQSKEGIGTTVTIVLPAEIQKPSSDIDTDVDLALSRPSENISDVEETDNE